MSRQSTPSFSHNTHITTLIELCFYNTKTYHFGDVPQANILAWYGKTKANVTKANIYQSKEKYSNTK